MFNKFKKIACALSIMFSSPNPLEYPEIELQNMYLYVGYGEQLSEQEFTNKFISIKDDKTPFNKLKIRYEPELKLLWPTNGYSTIFVTDENDNTSSKNFLYYVLDDVPPTIFGPSRLNFTKDDNIDISTILSYYSANDEIDGNINVTTDDDFNNQTTIINIKAQDNSNNISFKSIKINILEENQYWYVKTTLDLDNQNYYSAEDIVDILINKGYLENIDYLYACFKENVYESNYMIAGLYSLQIDIFTLNNSVPFTIDVELNVISNEIIETKEETYWWDSLFLFIKKLFQKIIYYFTF